MTTLRDLVGRSVEEQMRRASSRTTEQIARHLGNHFPMWVGCGFPKSGTVWLCKLMSGYLGVPYPQNYAMPIAMKSVVHAHWDYHPGLPTTAYIHRDGRDVVVSLYHHQMKIVNDARHPHAAAKLRRRFARLWGPSFDPGDTSGNMARFIEAEFADPAFMKCTWSRHVQDWLGTARPRVHAVGYEQLKADPVKAVAQLMSSIEGRPADQRRVELTVARNDFELTSGRQAGTEDTTNELRKGIVGDWRNVFTREAAEVLESCAGAQLRLLGYEQDASWVESVAH